jgi:ureidoglycolate hydrolase
MQRVLIVVAVLAAVAGLTVGVVVAFAAGSEGGVNYIPGVTHPAPPQPSSNHSANQFP